MTRKHYIEQHRRSLEEIRDIMNSMKTLAYMETRKLSRFINAQHAVVKSIESAASDMLSFYPEELPANIDTSAVIIVVGTERGFCGDFNHSLLEHLESSLDTEHSNNAMLIIVGRKLHSLYERDTRVHAVVDGASVVEEIHGLLNSLVNELAALQKSHGLMNVYCIYHGKDDAIVMQKLLPPFEMLSNKKYRSSIPPLLNMPPHDFLLALTDHYLFAALHQVLYTSLMMENLHRVSHLDGAVKHLDDELTELVRQGNALRQEEITEEIEVILLGAANLGEIPGGCDE